MQKGLRQAFNKNFTEEKYQAYVKQLEGLHLGAIDFRIGETPVFVPKDFTKKMLEASEAVIDLITDPKFKTLTEKAIPKDRIQGNGNEYPQFIAFDFGICEDENGEIGPQLIEMQGFPTLFAFQAYHSAITKKYADVPETHDAYLNDYNEETYLELLKEIIAGDVDPKQVILLDIFPEKQKTRIDFFCTEKLLGIKTVCLTKLIGKGNKLFYEDDGEQIEIKKIYNRLILADLYQQTIPADTIDITAPWQVEWVPHPDWFYRISKFVLPLVKDPYIPQTFFLNEIKQLPTDLEDYVLKPLFSFAGTGVVIDVTVDEIQSIKDPENWILQQKVKYAPAIETLDVPAFAEIRLFYFWKEGWARPIAVHNLARLSKGKMIGTRYNKDKTWVGASVAFFEK